MLYNHLLGAKNPYIGKNDNGEEIRLEDKDALEIIQDRIDRNLFALAVL